jgi:hypothetical protein
MSKINICVAFITILVNFGYSQQWYLGVNNGLDFNLYKFYNSDYIDGRTLVKPDVGWTFGFSGLYSVNRNVTLQGGLAITTKQLVPDLNKVNYIFESVHYTSLEIPLRLKYRMYSFSKNKIENENLKKRQSKKSLKHTKLFDPQDIQLSVIAGFSYIQMLKVSPQYFDDGNVTYPLLDLEKLIYPEFGICFSKQHKENLLFSIDIITRISRKPYEFSTNLVEMVSFVFGSFYKI